jgi:hypothetical protein
MGGAVSEGCQKHQTNCLLFGEVGADVEVPGGPLVRHRLALVGHKGVELLKKLRGCHIV